MRTLSITVCLASVLSSNCALEDLTTPEDPNDPFVRVAVFPKTISMVPNQDQSFGVLVFTQSGDTATAPVDWIATGGAVSDGGVYTAGATVGVFQVVVTLASNSNISDTATVSVEASLAPVATVIVNPSIASLTPNQTVQFVTILLDAQGDTLRNREVTWRSDNQSVASVNINGLATAVSQGSTNILATSEGVSDGATVNVSTGPSGDPIPGLATWERRMLEGGDRFCTEPIPPPSPTCCNGQQSVWYYDGIKVYYQIAEYTGDDKWKACAQRVVDVYRPWAFNPAPGLPFGFEVFTQGLRMHFEDTGDTVSRDAVRELAFSSPFAHLNVGQSIRERAYIAEALIDEFRVSGQKPAGYDNLITESIPELTASVDHPAGQAFMVGLLAEALIRHFEEVDPSDTRILPAVQTAMDKLWDSCVIGIRNPGRGDCGSWGPDVYQLVAPAFAWLYKMGQTQFGPKGDQLFAEAAVNGFFGSGKQFSQLYHWSFDYVRWRR